MKGSSGTGMRFPITGPRQSKREIRTTVIAKKERGSRERIRQQMVRVIATPANWRYAAAKTIF
jgi:hypothetical protein